jgi:hypothetical protein
VVLGGALRDRLNELSDRQIGQLLFDFCWVECFFGSPELTIVTQAIDRLRRSTRGAVTNNELSDRQIGQLLFDFCWPELYLNGPELIIVTQAIDRLRRSTGGVFTKEEAHENLRPQPVCPKCGNEMFLHYGIDEPDFWRCDWVDCRHKRYVGEL